MTTKATYTLKVTYIATAFIEVEADSWENALVEAIEYPLKDVDFDEVTYEDCELVRTDY